MTTTEAAAIAGVTPTTIRRWIATGRLVAGTKRLPHAPWCVWDISEEALAAAMANGRKPGRPYKHTPTTTPESQEVEGASKPC